MSYEPKFRTMVDIYRYATRTFAKRPLFGTKRGGEWQWSTYAEFGKTVDALRGAFDHLGLNPGEGVAVIANNRPEWAAAAYATYGLGGSYIPMYEAQLDKDWEYILEDCGAKILLVANESIYRRITSFRHRIPRLEHIVLLDGKGDEGCVTFAAALELGKEHPAELRDPEPDEVAGFIYTSGTTGNPKGVLLSQSNLASNVSAAQEVFPMQPDDRSLSFLPWAHSFGQTAELHSLFSLGASMGIAESVTAIVDNLMEIRPTLLFSVPRIFNKIYDGIHRRMRETSGVKKALFDSAMANAQIRRELLLRGKKSFTVEAKHAVFDRLVFSKVRDRFGGRLKKAFSGGAAISKEVAQFIDDLGIMVYEGYGLTETSPIATMNYPGMRKIGSVGRALPGVKIKLDHEITGDPEQGEILVYGHNVMKGYHNLPEENAMVFTEDGGFRTGDMGKLDSDGFLYITGRIKEQYKLENGKYVVPSPLEEKLKLCPYITNVMVYGDNRPYNVAIVVPDPEVLVSWGKEHGVDCSDLKTAFENAQVRALYEQQLGEFGAGFKQYEKVRKFELIEEDFTMENDMLTPSLKLKRRVVIERFGSLIDGMYA